MADGERPRSGGGSPSGGTGSPRSSPLMGASKKMQQSSPGIRSRQQQLYGPTGHGFRKVTLTKPTFCHHCTDFIWGLGGYQCEVCNFMSHEKCLKHVKTPCSCIAPHLVRVPVAHCFGQPRRYKKRFCTVCRKQLEGLALRCEVCELHVHVDCIQFACSDCRQCHHDGYQDHNTYHHHWREGSFSSNARCEVCKKTCGSSEVLSGMRCEWCGITAHAACYIILTPECTFGRLRQMILPPYAVRIYSRNFSKMHCFRISESEQPEPEEDDDIDGTTAGTVKDVQSSPDSSKQTLKIFDGTDAIKRNQFRLISVPRIAKSEEVVESALRVYYIPDEPQDYELQSLTSETLVPDDVINRNGTTDDTRSSPVFRESTPDAWILRAKPKQSEIVKIYPGWLRLGLACISIRISKESTVQTVMEEVLQQMGQQKDIIENFQLVEVQMGSKQVQRMVLLNHDILFNRLQEIRKTSIRQMNQTRFYIVENKNSVVQVNMLINGLPAHLNEEEYCDLLVQHLYIKRDLVSVHHVYSSQGAVVLDITCFSEAERVFMLVKDTVVNNKQLSATVLPEVMHEKVPQDCCPLLVFVNPKSGSLKGRELLYGFHKLLNPHQVFELTNGGPLPGFHMFHQVPYFRVLVCGGDGTVGWVLGVLEEIRFRLRCPQPAVAIVPLGTGNDLARVLRWGPGYSGEDPFSILLSVGEANEVHMDRWTILLDAQGPIDDSENGISEPEPPKIVQMNNYFGLGIDAELSLDFHQAREEDPNKFNSRFHNKGVYVKAGLQKIRRLSWPPEMLKGNLTQNQSI